MERACFQEEREVAALDRADIIIQDWHPDSLLVTILEFLWPWTIVTSSGSLVTIIAENCQSCCLPCEGAGDRIDD
jgi:hypothetical protein